MACGCRDSVQSLGRKADRRHQHARRGGVGRLRLLPQLVERDRLEGGVCGVAIRPGYAAVHDADANVGELVCDLDEHHVGDEGPGRQHEHFLVPTGTQRRPR